jgi:hypothetical protein
MIMKTSITRRPGRMSAYGRPWLGVQALMQSLLLVAVGAVGYALFTSDGIRTDLMSSRPVPCWPAEARPLSITYHEPAARGALLSFDLAVQSARQFTGQPDLALDGGLERGMPFQSDYAAYYLEGATDQTYRVDARTGEVLEMTRLDRLVSSGTDGARLDTLGADVVAEQFAANHFLGFSSLSLVDRNVAAGPDGSQLFTYKWALLASESGAELPTSVSLSLASASGEVVWYLAQRESALINVEPAVGRDLAISTAAVLVDRAARWDARTPSSVRLQVIFNAENQQQLVWAITFPSRADAIVAGRPSLSVLLDAQTGELLSSPA